MITYESHSDEPHVLTAEGEALAVSGSHEFRVWEVVGEEGMVMKDLQAALGAESAKVGQGKAFKNKWIKKRDDGGFVRAVRYWAFILDDGLGQVVDDVLEGYG